MATYTLTLTADQEALVQWLVQQYNLQHETSLDAQTFIASQLNSVLAPYAENYKQATLQKVQDAFTKADQKTQAQILALLSP